MIKNAIGLIETIGLAAAVEAADVAVKSANVELIGYELARGDGMTTVKILGDVGAVKAGVESAKAAAALVGKVYSTQVIPRPAQGLEALVYSNDTVGLAKETAPLKEVSKLAQKPVEPLNVVPEIIEEIKKEEPPQKTEPPKPAEVKKEEPKKVEPKKPDPKKAEPKKETPASTPTSAETKKAEEKPKPGDNKTPPSSPDKK